MNNFLAASSFIVLMTINGFSQNAGGINFVNGSWEEILALAEKENKPIFMDAYTDWCKPCKKMDQEVFSQKDVGTLYNEKFINFKMDMEGDPGRSLSQIYSVYAFPTLLYIAPDGSLLHRIAGFQNVHQLIELANVALDPNRRLATLKKRFDTGERDSEFLKNYTKASFAARDGNHIEIAEAYLATQDNWNLSANMNFIFSYTTNTRTKLFDHIIDNRDRYYEMFGRRRVTQRIQDLIYGALSDTKEESSLEQIDKLYQKVYPEQAAQFSAKFRLSFYRLANDNEKYAKAAKDYVENFYVTPGELNDIAFAFYENVDDPEMLKQAVKWAKKSIKADNNYYNNDTLASLYYKLGKKGKAKKAALKSIKLAKQTEADYRETQLLLDEILKM